MATTAMPYRKGQRVGSSVEPVAFEGEVRTVPLDEPAPRKPWAVGLRHWLAGRPDWQVAAGGIAVAIGGFFASSAITQAVMEAFTPRPTVITVTPSPSVSTATHQPRGHDSQPPPAARLGARRPAVSRRRPPPARLLPAAIA